MREFFAAAVERESPEAWRAGHQRLFEYLTTTTTPHRPDTLEGLEPLYQAVAHGCKAGLHEKALDDVYVDRILRGTGYDGFYSTRKLGAFGAGLGAVANFFMDAAWREPSPNLSPSTQAWLLNEAAFLLRALGRLLEALAPMRMGMEMAVEQEDWRNAAIYANHLSQLELTLGWISQAVDDGEQSVTFADKSGNALERMARRIAYADRLHQAGDREQVRALFQAAEEIQAKDQSEYLRLYSLQDFRYCELLLAEAEQAAWWTWMKRAIAGNGWAVGWTSAPGTQPPTGAAVDAPSRSYPPYGPGIVPGTPNAAGQEFDELIAECDRVTARATQLFEWRKLPQWNPAADSILHIALDHLTLARARLYRGLLAGDLVTGAPRPPAPAQGVARDAIKVHLTAAVAGLRKSGHSDHLPRGLLTRAWYRAVIRDPAGARADLDEAWEIATGGSMALFQADILLTRARLFGVGAVTGDEEGRAAEGYPWASVAADLTAARRLIEKHGYHRRDRELADAEGGLG
uniref:Uncharacterized protein n=1 Tax=Candidatus Kentrum sp. FM TaxID=2126340 RepID=A0A450SW18_9GAMM|nr:MAG: hypothetical protein BECKFM1743A_GA0114220_102082 [Candidatus Kentron sp. FM]VFJ60575.1 MAG: hypothetical protein BECKFM1743C_GA0114222_102762 [Candidatus Kentron sp. FM]VFK13792.1 MAG: hypothetical protein BECKFM1743B_GA0114221_102942 [Candidatus Kentron sp. FM]